MFLNLNTLISENLNVLEYFKPNLPNFFTQILVQNHTIKQYKLYGRYQNRESAYILSKIKSKTEYIISNH